MVGLLLSPTYYYHYSGFMAPFVALVMSACVVRLKAPVCGLFAVRSILLPDMLALFAVPTVIALLLGAIVTEVVHLPAAPHVADAVGDAIPERGCVLFANPTLALLDNRFTSDVSGCPDVIDWLGQERVLDNGRTASPSATNDRGLQAAMAGWIESSDAVVLGNGNVGLDGANVDYLVNISIGNLVCPGRSESTYAIRQERRNGFPLRFSIERMSRTARSHSFE